VIGCGDGASNGIRHQLSVHCHRNSTSKERDLILFRPSTKFALNLL
jgi:hypothetical protein